ncbi:MAG: hypothetical protein M3N95_04895, partial [Actinomycetota bacterium]|nr:hypothetical protein [Actinomycetota bacterium]
MTAPMLLVLDFDGVLTSSATSGGRLIESSIIHRLAHLPVAVEWLSMQSDHDLCAVARAVRLPDAGFVATGEQVWTRRPRRSWFAADA